MPNRCIFKVGRDLCRLVSVQGGIVASVERILGLSISMRKLAPSILSLLTVLTLYSYSFS
jgi:hypothetical protein